jgi:pimeloyl-ACP methyl ester carboxylesterase
MDSMPKTYRFNQRRSRADRSIIKFSLLLVLVISMVSSCKKDDIGSKYSYFVSKEQVLSYSSTYITGLVNSIAGVYPDINDIKSRFSGAVNVNRVIYKTKINGSEIEASGLVCTPVTPGEYPVICFQNGTNTVNEYAPSMFITNSTYQMVEIIASMGYVVIIPDYPGFGASAQIPHPYLIAESTVTSIVDMLFAVREMTVSEIPGISLKNQYFLIGYSQGGWATMALHKALETNYSGDFNLRGSVCGAGPYDIKFLFQSMINVSTYPMPVYLGYIVHAYSAYNQFTNPVSDILNEPYSSRLNSLFNGLLSSSQINAQLTTSVRDLITSDFLNGFGSSAKYASVRTALSNNSISPWHTMKPLYMLHGGGDTQVNPAVTTYFYDSMMAAGTSPEICTKEIIPGLDHGDGVAPCMIKGLRFILNLTTK